MRILLSWLRDFVDVPGTPEDVARTMSVRGFAVEGLDALPGGDAVIDFEVTANRPDCLSVVGMAREVATAYDLPLAGETSHSSSLGGSEASAPQAPLRLASPKAVDKVDIDVVIEDDELCPRYAGAVADVKVGPSPDWMQARLLAAGVRPISNIVDVTNYVLLELGHPMHAFDLAKIRGAQIRVRPARPGETLRTLDGQMRTLTPDMLVIADAERAAAVAGVMGGSDSEVTDSTTAIVLESAYFNPLSVRRTSKKLGLKTEASMRFERGADPNVPALAMARACALLGLTGAGRARGAIVDNYPRRREPSTLRLRRHKVAGLLGVQIPDADVRRILERLGFGLNDTPDPKGSSPRAAADGWIVTIPTRRIDVAREVDLIEEVARHYGFDRLPVTFPALTVPAPAVDPHILQARGLRALLTAAGFSEAVTFGFIAGNVAAPFAAAEDLIPIANPLSENFGVLRPSVIPGLMMAVAHNRRREQRDVRLFEIGARFLRRAGEKRAVACAWTGAGAIDHWSGGAREVDFFDIKGAVERICQGLRVDVHTAAHQEAWLVPGRAAAARHDGTTVGIFGQLAAPIAEAYGLPSSDAVYVAEIDLDAVEAVAATAPIRVEPLPRYPSVTRDVSILIDDTLAAERVRQTVHAAAPSALVRIREFDRYQGKGVPESKVSLSLRMTFRSPDRTLTDTEVQAAMDDIVNALKREHGAVQR